MSACVQEIEVEVNESDIPKRDQTNNQQHEKFFSYPHSNVRRIVTQYTKVPRNLFLLLKQEGVGYVGVSLQAVLAEMKMALK